MVDFDRKTVYLGYYENGVRIGNAGSLKIEVWDRVCRMDMHVRWKRMEKDQAAEVILQPVNEGGKPEAQGEVMAHGMADLCAASLDNYGNGSSKLGRISLTGGEGSFRKEFSAAAIGDAELSYSEAAGILIPLGPGKLIRGNWKPQEKERKEEKACKPEKEIAVPRRGIKTGMPSAVTPERPDLSREKGREEPAPNKLRIVMPQQDGAEKAAGLSDDKWEQLLRSYPNMHPYEDERVYISLAPKDFVILTAQYQHLCNNSFLLHGFYNYRHVILGVEEGKFYLGVPGVYYEREKMVAIMFGFEAFECVGGVTEEGTFGYYLRRVQI